MESFNIASSSKWPKFFLQQTQELKKLIKQNNDPVPVRLVDTHDEELLRAALRREHKPMSDIIDLRP